jgi:modification methylase
LNKIICGDILAEMRKMDDGCVDLVVTSPPYNLKNSTGNGMKDGRGSKWTSADDGLRKGYDKHEDSLSREEYIEWMKECVTEMFRVLKPSGAIFFNHKFRVQGGLMEGHPFLEPFNVRQMIIWSRAGGFNFNDSYFLPTYEVVYVMPKTAKGEGSFRLKKGGNKKGDVWRINQEKKSLHPAPFPVELVDNILTSCEGKVVLDPFGGSGTVAVSAIKNGWDYILIDNSHEYCRMAEDRINSVARVEGDWL